MKTQMMAIAAGALLCAGFAVPAAAQVQNGVYRGTLVCDLLPFARGRLRSAIETTISGNSAKYTHPVLQPETGTVLGQETGTGSVDGQNIKLSGGWRGDKDSYEATYSGTFVRRSAKLAGKQVWSHDGKSYSRDCSGVIKRPLNFPFRRG